MPEAWDTESYTPIASNENACLKGDGSDPSVLVKARSTLLLVTAVTRGMAETPADELSLPHFVINTFGGSVNPAGRGMLAARIYSFPPEKSMSAYAYDAIVNPEIRKTCHPITSLARDTEC